MGRISSGLTGSGEFVGVGPAKTRFAFIQANDFYAGIAQLCLDRILVFQAKAVSFDEDLRFETTPFHSFDQRRRKLCRLRYGRRWERCREQQSGRRR